MKNYQKVLDTITTKNQNILLHKKSQFSVEYFFSKSEQIR